MKSWIIGLIVLSLALGGCAANMGPKEGAGTVIGGVGGAVLGSQFGRGTGRVVGAAIGGIAGALLGQDIGRQLDDADRMKMQSTAQYALENDQTGHTTEWRNPDTGHYGTVTPKRTFRRESGQYCREYQQTVVIGGEERQAYGTACRQPDGTWKIVR
jgi:surface antigen